MHRITIPLVFLMLTGCTSVKVGQHITAKDYTRSPQRIFVVSRLDSSFERTLPRTFADAIVPLLGRCNVVATVYQSGELELDAETKFKTAFDQFKPDAVLNMQQARRFSMTEKLAPAPISLR